MYTILSIFIIVLFIYIFFICITQVFTEQGYTFPKFISSFIPTKPSLINRSYTPTRYDLLFIALGALLFRLLFLVLSYLILVIFEHDTSISMLNFLEYITEWDGNNYYRIAELGYDGWIENGYKTTLVFFPLYPFISYLLNFIIHNTQLSLLIVSITSYVGGCCYLYLFVSKEYGKQIASKTVMYISIFPFSFFFGTMMPESLFFLLICATLYYINEHRWFIAAIFGMLATTTRLQGILILIPFVLELIEHYNILLSLKKKEFNSLKQPLLKLLYIPIYFIGFGIYLLCNYIHTGNPFYFLILQKKIWGHSFDHPGAAIAYNLKKINTILNENNNFSSLFLTWLPQLLLFIIILILLIYSVRHHKPKHTCYLLVYFFISYGTDFLLSGGRYMSVSIPLFIIIACIMDKHPFLNKCCLTTCLCLNLLFNASYIFSKLIV